MSLNSPDIRQARLRAQLEAGRPLAATDLAREFGVSLDTIRRDLAALEAEGAARRVRGGIVPLVSPAPPLRERMAAPPPEAGLIDRALEVVGAAGSLILDGGTSVLALAERLAPLPGRLVITPAPAIAAATHRRGIETVTLGGRLSEPGGIATGPGPEAELAGIAAEVTVLGACGLDAAFGLSSDDYLENAVKAAMARAGRRRLVLAGAAKLGRRARYRTLPPELIDAIVTDCSEDQAAPFRAADIEVCLA